MTNTEDTDKYPTQPLARPEALEDDEVEAPTLIETPEGDTWRRTYPVGDEGQEEIVTPPPRPTFTPPPTFSPPPTPAPLPVPPPLVERQQGLGAIRFLVGLSLVISIAALALSAFIIYSFMSVQQTVIDGLDRAVAAIDDFEGEGFHYDYSFQQTIPVSVSIPIEREMMFPFSGDFPINTTVEVPIRAGILGEFTIDVPINTSVHIDTEVPVAISQTFDISTSIPISMAIPIDVGADDPAVQDLFGKLRAWLMDLRDAVDTGLVPPGP